MQVTIFIQGLYPFELFKFHDFFHDLFQFSMALVLAFTFKNFQNYSCFGDIFTYVIQLNRHKLWCPTKPQAAQT